MPAIRPLPKVGVGMRKMTLPLAKLPAKFGCWMTESVQPGASERPAIVKRSWTPPSAEPFGFLMKRTSRTGPLAVMNEGIWLVAPCRVATLIWGLVTGLLPAGAGWGGQPGPLVMLTV